MKKGYMYYVEILFLILLVIAILALFPKHQAEVISAPSDTLSQRGFSALVSLDRMSIFDRYVYSNSSVNSTAIDAYVRAELPNTINFKINYYDDDSCFYPGACGSANLTAVNVQVAQFTYAYLESPITIKMYLWEVFR